MEKKNPLTLILLTGLLTGSLDILAAFVDHYLASGKGPEGVLRFIASGVFGKRAFSDGNLMIVWGLLFHYAIAFSFTTFFYWLYPKIKLMAANKLLTGIIYGIFIWAVMSVIVVPLSNTPKFNFNFLKAIKAILILICMIGLPLSFLAKKYLRNN